MIENKTVLGVTLARGGSKSVPNKNLALVGNKSLLRRALEAKSKYCDRHVVSSDCDRILAEAERLGATPLKRPAELATDAAKSSDAIAHALEYFPADIILEVMCTAPFTTAAETDLAVEKLYSTGADSVVGVARVLDHHPARLKYIVDDQLVNFFPEEKESRRQDLLPHAYVRSGSVYCFTRESFEKYASRYGGVCRPLIMPYGVNVDEAEDLELCRILAEKYGI